MEMTREMILFYVVLFVSRTVQAPQLIRQMTDETHRQRIVGSFRQFVLVLGTETNDEKLHFGVVVDAVASHHQRFHRFAVFHDLQIIAV